MNRRKFLTNSLVGLGALFLTTQVHAMPEANMLRASQGQILGLSEDGTRWQVRANLGRQYTVLGIYPYGDTFSAKVSFEGHVFFLKSSDGFTWYTADWSKPSTWQYQTAENHHG